MESSWWGSESCNITWNTLRTLWTHSNRCDWWNTDKQQRWPYFHSYVHLSYQSKHFTHHVNCSGLETCNRRGDLTGCKHKWHLLDFVELHPFNTTWHSVSMLISPFPGLSNHKAHPWWRSPHDHWTIDEDGGMSHWDGSTIIQQSLSHSKKTNKQTNLLLDSCTRGLIFL